MKEDRQIKRIFLYGVISFFLLWQGYENSSVEIQIPSRDGRDLQISMPRKDRKRLEQFFYKIMILEDGGYTLLGSKPMHMSGFYQPISTSNWEFFLNSVHPKNLRAYSGWKTWLKYQHFFANSEFLLWVEKNPFWQRSVRPNPAVSVFLLDKRKLKEAVNTYAADFQEVLGNQNISYEQLLLAKNNRSFFNDVLQRHEGLIGTLFGYGRDNAWLFEEKMRGNKVPLEPVWSNEIYEYFMTMPYYSWAYFGIRTRDFSQVLDYPCFLANPNTIETQNLKQSFLDTRKRILAYYENQDFLVATLSVLLNGDAIER
ncbi:MAG: hypothetical protein NTX49_01615 [Chlamydiae bacterium]|nr:hypothetical protein [Chlamydiota bacterium]